MKRLAIAAAIAAAALAAPPVLAGQAHVSAHAAVHTIQRDAWPLHGGSVGPRVAGWQWMISGHCPNRFAVACGGKVKPTLHRYTPGVDGPRTKSGTIALRYRLGFPAKGQCGAKASKLVSTVGPWFWALLRGQRDKHGHLIATRPACWVGLAQSRVELLDKTQPTPLALEIANWEIHQVGTREYGWNTGTVKGPGGWSINDLEAHFHLYALAYCEIFQEDAFDVNGYKPIPFAPAPIAYSVIPTYQWAAAHGYASAKPQIGSLMAWIGDAGHIGYVVAIDADSAGNVHGYTTVEGNTHPEGGGAEGVWIKHYPVPGSSLRLFINLPGVTH
jgi:hypothetical protein